MSAIAASRTAVTSPGGGFYITVTSNKGVTTKRVHGDLLTVGRAENCGLSIAHEALSRRHLSVTLVDGVCWIEDHGSSNGTTLNGQRIKPHEPLRVRPEDVIELGQSGTKLAISAEPQMWKSAAQAAPEPVAEDSIVTTTSHERAQVRAAQTSPSPKLTEEAQAQAEKLVQEAQKKAATLIQEAEIDAERRVQDIYRRAHETQAKTDEIYQRRLNE
ncbi:MAG TPA: FHA domain-containing protein, partial [Bdellovibrionales bacterium]|nr:FHA domain-containing protein [Bdellovibrionales bacterium]